MDNIIAVGGVGLWTLLSIALVIALVWGIVNNLNVGQHTRRVLAESLSQLRLQKMLKALGINANEYLHREKLVDVHEQIQQCAQCANTRNCDDALVETELNVDAIGFCANEAVLRDMKSR